MAIRTRLSPGTEIHEIDRSQYTSKTDYSLVNTTSLVCGFADKGEDYTTQWINSKQTLVDTYGYPKTEFERYFYNAGIEILQRGGVLLMAKIPYEYKAYNSFAVCDYKVCVDLDISASPYSTDLSAVDTSIKKYALIGEHVKNKDLSINIDIVNDFRGAIKTIADEYDQIYNIDDVYDILSAAEHLHTVLTSTTDLSTLSVIREELYDIVDNINEKGGSKAILADDKLISLSTLDQLLTSTKVLEKNTIKIIDITRSTYDKANIVSSDLTSTSLIAQNCECLGIMPLIVTPMNALFYQGLIQHTDCMSAYEPVQNMRRRIDRLTLNKSLGIDDEQYLANFNMDFTGTSPYDFTLSELATRNFPGLNFKDANYLDRSYLRQIGVIVFKVYRDYANNNKISFTPLESFIGSLDKTAVDSSGKSIFIDKIINSQSQYIKFFSNVDIPHSTDIIVARDQIGTVLGLTEKETIKTITPQSIMQAIDLILDKDKDLNTTNIDLIVDAGITTIAQCASDVQQAKSVDEIKQIVKNDSWLDDWKLESRKNSKVWYSVASKFDTFCKITRKDCMFLADGLRSFSLESDIKLVRPTVLESSVERTLVPKLQQQMTLNSSYSAGYIDWFQKADNYSGDLFWCPPSIKAAGVYTYTDAYFHPWDAPAGMTRGIVMGAVDVSFNPMNDEAGRIYAASWNYAKSYPEDGIVIEGQKTFQKSPTALDRINVRRLLLSLEKKARAAAKYFKYEGNTEYLRNKFIDILRPIFDDAIDGKGISQYAMLCDETNNTADVIDNNEMRCQVAVKPIKCIEWIVLDFICTNQSMSVSEEVSR